MAKYWQHSHSQLNLNKALGTLIRCVSVRKYLGLRGCLIKVLMHYLGLIPKGFDVCRK